MLAAEQQEVENFILLSKVETYDCPNEKYSPQLDNYLADPQLSPPLRLRLQVQKAQALICVGQYEQAKALLVSLVDNAQLAKDSRQYASAIYQLGFIYDVEEDSRRCDYYHQAQELAKGQFNDIYLSAQLGQITMCDSHSEDNSLKLGRLYALLEEVSATGDKAAIAHIHNNIGLLYGSIGQHVLAAEQYKKSYQMGLGVYEKNNLLATLISAITSHLASGKFDDAKEDIEEFKKTNKEVNTPLSNVWLHFAESSYYYRTGNYAGLKNSLLRWQVFLPKVSNYQLLGLYRWHFAALCLHDKDEACLRSFLQQEEAEKPEYKALIQRNKDYLRLLVDIQLFLGDIGAAQSSFTRFADTMLQKAMDQQASAKVLGVANMQAKILSLESSLADEREDKILFFGGFGLTFLLLIMVIYLAIKRYLLKQSSLDPLTGLLNEASALQVIKQLARPSEHKINALALFNLDNFKDINALHGHKSADLALRYAANCLRQTTREDDIVGRFETEKFVVCLADVDEKVAGELFSRVNQALEQSCFNSEYGEEIKVKVSMPVCFSADRFNDIDDMLANIRDNFGNRKKA